jgi:hypothetical protein
MAQLNRKQRRQKERDAKKAQKETYNLTKEDIRKTTHNQMMSEIDLVRKKALQLAVWDLTATFIISLHDEFGFGKKRIEKFLERASRQFECINSGLVTIEDMKGWCKEHELDYQAIFQEEPQERVVKIKELGVKIHEKK